MLLNRELPHWYVKYLLFISNVKGEMVGTAPPHQEDPEYFDMMSEL